MPREDTDTWDLGGSVGATATVVAAARGAATHEESSLIDDPFAEPLVRAVGIDFLTRWAAGELDPDGDGALPVVRGFTVLMAARTRYFDRFLLEATAGRIAQVVILASGLDTRGYRLPFPEGTVVFEVDQPAVIDFKATELAGLGAEPITDLRAVRIDLRQNWAGALGRAGFDAEAPTVWLAEGLLPYLRPSAQDRLLDEVTALSTAGSRLAAEIFIPPGPEAMKPIAQRWHRPGFDVDMSDLVYRGERADVGEYLNSHGWEAVTVPMNQLLVEYGLPTRTGREVFAGNVYYSATRLSSGTR